MKVMHINSYYSVSKFYKNLYDIQKKSGAEIDVYVPVNFSYDNRGLDLGEYTTVSYNHSKLDRMFFFLKHRKIYLDVISKFKVKDYSIIHAHSLFSNGYIALNLKKKYGVPYIVAVRNTDVNLFFRYMVHLREIGNEILKEADNVIFLSESYRDQTIQRYVNKKLKNDILNKSRVIPNGIEEFWLANKPMPKKINNSDIKILYVGVINKNKNILMTIKAIEVLVASGYSVSFTVVGEIQNQSIHDKLVEYPYVSYMSPLPKDKLINIYRMNDIFVMPSINETFGLVYAEAMSQGIPVIYSEGQGFDGQFDEALVGYSVNCYDAHDIAEKILKVVENYYYLSENSILFANKFNWHRISDLYNEIYLESFGR